MPDPTHGALCGLEDVCQRKVLYLANILIMKIFDRTTDLDVVHVHMQTFLLLRKFAVYEVIVTCEEVALCGLAVHVPGK